ncbi:transposase [Thalassobium sp. R2A62]|uniref:transposase n=1 Tax=Thalassobium sp. R2A62 TaxID=633131 RepID=UPI00350E3552
MGGCSVWPASTKQAYSEATIQACLTLKLLFGLPERQTAEFGHVWRILSSGTGLSRTTVPCSRPHPNDSTRPAHRRNGNRKPVHAPH